MTSFSMLFLLMLVLAQYYLVGPLPASKIAEHGLLKSRDLNASDYTRSDDGNNNDDSGSVDDENKDDSPLLEDTKKDLEPQKSRRSGKYFGRLRRTHGRQHIPHGRHRLPTFGPNPSSEPKEAGTVSKQSEVRSTREENTSPDDATENYQTSQENGTAEEKESSKEMHVFDEIPRKGYPSIGTEDKLVPYDFHPEEIIEYKPKKIRPGETRFGPEDEITEDQFEPEDYIEEYRHGPEDEITEYQFEPEDKLMQYLFGAEDEIRSDTEVVDYRAGLDEDILHNLWTLDEFDPLEYPWPYDNPSQMGLEMLAESPAYLRPEDDEELSGIRRSVASSGPATAPASRDDEGSLLHRLASAIAPSTTSSQFTLTTTRSK